jgi:hypothetical protein
VFAVLHTVADAGCFSYFHSLRVTQNRTDLASKMLWTVKNDRE